MNYRTLIGAAVIGVLTVAAGQAAEAGDLAEGEKVFNKCKACHTLEAGKHKIGPSLHGVIGRAAGAAEGFKYSKAMAEAGIQWTEETLDQYITNPREFIKGNKMAFPGLKDEEDRENVIALIRAAMGGAAEAEEGEKED